jgi:hypothetical protein
MESLTSVYGGEEWGFSDFHKSQCIANFVRGKSFHAHFLSAPPFTSSSSSRMNNALNSSPRSDESVKRSQHEYLMPNWVPSKLFFHYSSCCKWRYERHFAASHQTCRLSVKSSRARFADRNLKFCSPWKSSARWISLLWPFKKKSVCTTLWRDFIAVLRGAPRVQPCKPKKKGNPETC